MTDESLVKTILEHGKYICEQTNAVDISFVKDINDCDNIHEIDIDGYKIKIGFKIVEDDN